jgi:hypothetical protein
MLDNPSKVAYKQLDMLITGRLNHCNFLIPQGCHFMGCICTPKHSVSKGWYMLLSSDVQLDLALWTTFLASIRASINMNNITSIT